MSALLVMTTGRTDVQLVKGNTRWELSKKSCAELHDKIERRAGEWRLVESPPSKGEEAEDSLPEDDFALCTPKLDAVLRYPEEKPMPWTSALILGTRRDAEAEPGDPRYAGQILECRLRERGITDVRSMPYLIGRERLEDRDDPRGAVIRREAVSRLDEAVRDAVAAFQPAHIVVATTGGFPQLNNLVDAIVHLYAAGSKVDLLEVPETAEGHAVSRTSIPEPAESFRARKHALDLIEKGNLLGAWGAVQHLDEYKDKPERRWTKVVEWLALFAASQPMPEECDINVLKHQHKAVRSALRVELALRSGDIPRAVHGTVAFFESALWDHLKPRLTRHKSKPRLYKVDPAPNACLVKKGDGSSEDQRRPFEAGEEANGITWYKVFDDDVRGIRLAKHYLKNERLQNLGQAVSKVRDLRNDVAHNEPTPELMEEARSRMMEASLWSKDSLFLTQPLVENVLRELGEQKPADLCSDLLSTVRSRLLQTVAP